MKIIKYLYLLIIITLPLAQLTRISLGANTTIFLNDFLIPVLLVLWLVFALVIRKKLFLPPLSGRILLFSGLAIFSLLLGLRGLNFNDGLNSSLFLLRWFEYASLYFIGVDLFVNEKNSADIALKALIFSAFLIAIAGFFQYILIPDFSQIASAGGWDPHQYRLLSTFLDPNFVGGFFVVMLGISVSWLLAKPNIKLKIPLLLFSATLLVALVLTFSRSAYLAFIFSALTFGLLKSRKVFLGLVVFAVLAVLLLPPLQQRLQTTLGFDDSAKARVVSWSNAWEISKDNILVGVGYNTYRYVQIRYGFIDPLTDGGHSGSGADSSFLLVLATTGVIGLFSYLTIIVGFGRMAFTLRTTVIGLGFLAGGVSLLVDSQFINALFYPQIMETFWILAAILGATYVTNKAKSD